jgi:hypothetical protein
VLEALKSLAQCVIPEEDIFFFIDEGAEEEECIALIRLVNQGQLAMDREWYIFLLETLANHSYELLALQSIPVRAGGQFSSKVILKELELCSFLINGRRSLAVSL